MKKKIVVGVGLVVSASNVIAAAGVAEGRGTAMGSVGVASADYLSGAFYNPALTAIYRNNDDFGLLLPAIGANLNDQASNLDTLDALEGQIDAFEASPTQANSEAINNSLDKLAGAKSTIVTAGVGAAISIPSKKVSANIFARGYVNIVAKSNISDDTDVTNRYNNSTVDLVGFGYSEFGIAFAKDMKMSGERIAFGISPKYQILKSYAETVSVNNFDLDDYEDSEQEATGMNFDVGAVWHHKHYHVGLAVKDVLSTELKAGSDYKYELKPQATIGAAYKHRFFTIAADLDLTTQGHFKGLEDDTQYFRFGMEGNAWDWLQVRAGLEYDMEGTYDTAFTGGIGLSPFDAVNIDVAGTYSSENQYGLSTNLALTF